MSQRNYGQYRFEASKQEKVMFPDASITKGEIIDYYDKISDYMLPHIRQRPLTMQRFPDGIEDKGFYEKRLPDHFPDWIDRVTVATDTRHGTQEQVLANKRASLAYLANQVCITPHVWLSRADAPDKPDRMIFDLDPPDDNGSFEPVRDAANKLHALCKELGVAAFVKTTGSRGVHVVIPLQARHGFDDVRDAARALAERLANRHPDKLTTQVRKNKREGRLFLDTARNAYGQTVVAPYATRALPDAPVATPLSWQELNDPKTHTRRFTFANIFRRLGQVGDRWYQMHRYRRSLDSIKSAMEASG